MFERFTEQARKVVVLSQEEAQYFNHDYIDTEHILLGLLREPEGAAVRALSSLNLSVDEVRAQVESIVGYGEKGTGGQMPFTSRSKKVLERALREALQFGHDYIGTEHILLGLVRESEGVAARILSNLGIDPEKVRHEVVRTVESRLKSGEEDRKTTAIRSETRQNPGSRRSSNTEKGSDPDFLPDALDGDRSQRGQDGEAGDRGVETKRPKARQVDQTTKVGRVFANRMRLWYSWLVVSGVAMLVPLCRGAELQQFRAALQIYLGTSLFQGPLGERPENIERAIHYFEQALEVYTPEDFPQEWAMTQNTLALAYSDRIRGDRAENLEEVIHRCEQALGVLTPEDFPKLWAMTQSSLATAYSDRICGDQDENLEEAIEHYELVLEGCTQEDLPKLWAETQDSLANAYFDRAQGDQAENLERVIHHFEQALEVYTQEDFPKQWASTQVLLALAFSVRIRGDRAENLEEAIHFCKQALGVNTRQDFPERWASTQSSLAMAYWARIRGDRAENFEQAIQHHKQALEVYTQEDFPERWAMIQNSLAVVYSDRIRGDRAENLEEAIHRCKQALGVYTRQDFPGEWAETQNNLATAYRNRIRGDRAENLELAIHHCRQALEVHTRPDLSWKWAITQNNLASAYRNRIRGERAQNLEHAIHHYEQALEIRTARTFPQDCRDTAYDLSYLLYDERRFAKARKVLTTAHEAVEALRGEVRREAAKRNLAEQNTDLYARLVHCCLLEDDEEAAFEYAAAGKGRTFVDMLATARFDLSAAGADDSQLAEDLRKIRDLSQQISSLLARLSTNNSPSGPSSIPTVQRKKMRQQIGSLLPQVIGYNGLATSTLDRHELLKKMRTDLHDLQVRHDVLWEEMTYKYPALTATQQAPTLTAKEARDLAAELGATLVEYYEHADGWCAFAVTPGEMRRVPLPGVNDELFDQMSKWLEWLESPAGLGPLSYGPLRRLHEALIEPLRPYLPPDMTVVMAPFGKLHLLPLGAALDPTSGRYAADDYRLSFAPSLAALRVTLEQVRRNDHLAGQRIARRLLSVAYPGNDSESETYLKHAVAEAEAVARRFEQATPLYQEAATPEAVLAHARGQEVIHLVCHGSFRSETLEQSGLELSSGHLTVQRIITELHLDRSRLTTLSACESGRLEVRQAEEHVGLVQAVMSAGAQAVVAGLWEVDDAATQALFKAFYARVTDGDSPADALGEAAREVRGSPGWEHPYYWAAFQASGLAYSVEDVEQRVGLPTG